MTNVENIKTFDDVKRFININKNGVVLFSRELCGVCQVIKPKIRAVMKRQFSRFFYLEIDGGEVPEAAGQWTLFTVPALLLFFEGREVRRWVRSFGVQEIVQALEKPYTFLQNDE